MERMTIADAISLPTTVDLMTAARAIGLGRTIAYELAQRGEFPCRLLKIGDMYRVPTAELLRLLGIDPISISATSSRRATPNGITADIRQERQPPRR